MGWVGELPPEEKARQAKRLENSLKGLRGQEEAMKSLNTVPVDPRTQRYEENLRELKPNWAERD